MTRLRAAMPDIVAGTGVLCLAIGAGLIAPALGFIVLGLACIALVRFGGTV